MLFKLIVRFMGFIYELSALAIIGLSADFAFNYASQAGADSMMQWIAAAIGCLCGLLVAAIVLGMPILLLRINQNLDELNTNMRKVRERVDSHDGSQQLTSASIV
ncbi:MAG: hypothetical protein JSR26_03525 [Proteobacteria bacterium]|nr:hypothetical protein [Pseudomonadota bacterium]